MPTAFCALVVVIMLIVLSSCNAEKRTTRKAERKLDKSVRLDPMVAARYCATRYSPIDSVNERIIYKAGKTIYDTVLTTEIEIINDTVYLNKVKTITVTKHDTVDRTRFERAAFKAALDTMERHYKKEMAEKNATIKEQDKKIASQSTTINYLWILVAILGAYTLARWLLSYFTKGRVRLP